MSLVAKNTAYNTIGNTITASAGFVILPIIANKLRSDGYGVISVAELRNFLLNSAVKLINNTTSLPWSITQDLEPLYEINHVMFIAKRGIYLELKNRVGKTPFMYKMNRIQSLDVHREEDFIIAEEVFRSLHNSNGKI